MRGLVVTASVVAASLLAACGGDVVDLGGRVQVRPIAVPPGDVPVEPPPPVTPLPSTPSSTLPEGIGREESRGHQSESRTPGEEGEAAPVEGVACGYICRGLARCTRRLGPSTCDLCPSGTDVVRGDCRDTFERLESCLSQTFAFVDCQQLFQVGGAQLASACGVDPFTLERCLVNGNETTPVPLPGTDAPDVGKP